MYSTKIDNHLSKFISLRYNISPFKFTYMSYIGTEQYICEEYLNDDIDWEFADVHLVQFKNNLRLSLGSEYDSHKDFVRYVRDAYENYLVFEKFGRQGVSNPFSDLYDLIFDGYLFFVASDMNSIWKYFPEYKGNGLVWIIKTPDDELIYYEKNSI